jgi:hypothetical protein
MAKIALRVTSYELLSLQSKNTNVVTKLILILHINKNDTGILL